MKLLILISSALCMTANCQDFIYSNEAAKRPNNENLTEVDASAATSPIFDISKCPSDQLVYPGKNKSDWFCDCAPGHIYHPSSDKCYPVYRQGPCNKGEHLVFKTDRKITECVTNPCEEGSVRYKGQCYQLDSPSGPCGPVSDGNGVFGINVTTLEVNCLKGTELLSLFKIPANCPPGSKRDSRNRCRENFNV